MSSPRSQSELGNGLFLLSLGKHFVPMYHLGESRYDSTLIRAWTGAGRTCRSDFSESPPLWYH
jgi:hypothetical protein